MIKVIKGGLYTTIQDLGRFGYRNIGVPVSGSMDAVSAKMANLLLNNNKEAAVLEITLSGPTLLFDTDAIIVITGAEMTPKINNESIRNFKPYNVIAGDILSFGKLLQGARSYLAVKGGVKSEKKLNSRSQFNCITTGTRINKDDVIEIDSRTTLPLIKGKLHGATQFFQTKVIEVYKGPEFNLL